ncbi:g11347 [Coccomyxa viridis]|uniref:G11347 protein n=1 Tax=Coccomyxa viridis TaxID=1274662 RepID=A0ABP1GDF9_9CHLO
MAGRLIANLIVAGGGILIRAAAQAYRQALVNAQRQGVTQETLKAATRARQLTVEEAEKILGIEKNMSYEEVLRKYNYLFERNEKDGTFYLQSKVYRARERLEQEWGVNLEEASGQRQQQAAEAQQQGRNSQG